MHKFFKIRIHTHTHTHIKPRKSGSNCCMFEWLDALRFRTNDERKTYLFVSKKQREVTGFCFWCLYLVFYSFYDSPIEYFKLLLFTFRVRHPSEGHYGFLWMCVWLCVCAGVCAGGSQVRWRWKNVWHSMRSYDNGRGR